MQFKVGDRVEVLEPAAGLFSGEANNIGLGSVVRVDEHGCQLEIKVDDNNRAWWYELDKVRHPIVSKPTPTPSITVGTQVRLTGVVEGYDSLVHPERVEVRIDGVSRSKPPTWVHKSALEVIRQPFKRGEVVWSCGAVATGIAYQVLGDETDLGDVLLIKEGTEGGNKSFVAHHSDFERRPSRPKEER